MAAGEAEVVRKALIESVAEGMRDAFAQILRESVAAEMGADRLAWVESHRLLDDEGAARLLGTTTGQLRDLCATQGLPHLTIGRRYRYDRQALMSWIEANTQRGEVIQ